MDVAEFIAQLLPLLTTLQQVHSVTYSAEGPIVDGNAVIGRDTFLRFYYNSVTGTTAFALIRGRRRVWGLDYDNRRGWHLHPFGAPDEHVSINPATLPQIIEQLRPVLLRLER